MTKKEFELPQGTYYTKKEDDYVNSAPSKSSKNDIEMTEVRRNEPVEEQKNGKVIQGDEDAEELPSNCYTRTLEQVENGIEACSSRYQRPIKYTVRTITFLLYMAYFGYCMSYKFGDEGSIMLVVITCIIILVIIYKIVKSRSRPDDEGGCWASFTERICCSRKIRRTLRYVLYVVAAGGIAAYLVIEVFPHNPKNIQSLIGIGGVILGCFLFSSKKSRINWHPVFWGFMIQFAFATLTLQTQVGYDIFDWLGESVESLLMFSSYGAEFVLGENYASMGLAFSSGGMIIFFGALMGLLIHWGVLEAVVIRAGRALSTAMETGPVESVVAIANIFIGLSQAPLLIRPYLPTLSNSELNAVMTCGYASVSGDLMTMFIVFGAPANHLLTAAIISAPAALAVSKILVPETQRIDADTQQAIAEAEEEAEDKSRGALGSAADGAMIAVRALVAAMANMIAFVSLLALVNAILEWGGERAGFHGLTFEGMCGYILYPLAYAMGVRPEDCGQVGTLIGVKLFATPVIAYSDLGKLVKNRERFEAYMELNNGTWEMQGGNVLLHATNETLLNGFMEERSEAIATYAMCGFSAFTAIGISIGTLTPLCPSRKLDIISLVPAAFLGGNMASFATGAIAGLLHVDS